MIAFKKTATIKRELVPLLTYPFSDPSPVPEFGRLYPYNRFDGYTDKGKMQEWEMIVMENEHIKLWINPSVGGKIWGAIEKSTGKEFIYFNHVAKFRDVAMRGPWTSGGMEVNMGIIGHTPSCSAPVDHALRENADGSVSCFIGATDWPSRTNWMVEIILPADTAYFTTRSSWYNNSRLEQSYYQWNNIGVKAAGNLEYINPGHQRIGHDGKTFDWPIDEQGHEISLYEKNDFGEYKSYHIFGSYADFWGCYWHNDQFGFGHSATYDDKPGKKIWIWGLSRYGMIWEHLLTDTDGQYTEVQSGRLFNQSIAASSKTPFKHVPFIPYVHDRWDEHWFPVNNIGGLTYGSELLSFYIDKQIAGAVLRICANQPLNGELKLEAGTEAVIVKNIDLQTLQQEAIALPAIDAESLKIYFNNGLIYDGPAIHHRLNRPVETPTDFDFSSVQSLYTQAKEWELQRFYERAVNAYNVCLDKDPFYTDALVGLAGIRIRQCLYEQAQELLLKALSVNTYHPEANYLYGVVNISIGQIVDAKDGFSIASQSPQYRTAAYVELAKAMLCEKQYERALNYVEKALQYNIYNQQAIQLQLLIARLQGRLEVAGKLVAQQLATNPLDYVARFEEYQLGLITADCFKSRITSELSHETYLELAIFYFNLNLDTVALEVLALSPSNAMVCIWIAFIHARRQSMQQATLHMQNAMHLPPDFVFPHRQEDVQVLEWAAGYYQSWKLKYYLALAYIQMLRNDEALQLLLSCGDEPDFYVFYIVRANLQRDVDAAACENDLHRANQQAPQEWRTSLLLSRFLADQQRWVEALEVVNAGYQHHPGNYYLGLHLAACLMHTARYEDGIELMNSLKVLPNEGASDGRNIWKETHLYAALNAMDGLDWEQAIVYIAQARMWPEHMGVGRPYDVDERLENFMELYCLQQSHQSIPNELIGQVANYRHQYPETPYSANDFLSIFLLKQQGEFNNAQQMLINWQLIDADDLAGKWARAFFADDLDELEHIAQQQPPKRIPLPYEILFEDRSFVFIKNMYNRQFFKAMVNAENITQN